MLTCVFTLCRGARFHAGWQLRGSGIQFRMRPGTVVPSNHSVYIAADLKAFRSVHGVNSPVFVVGPSYGTFPSEGSVTVSLYDRYEHLGMFTHCLPHFPTWYDAVARGRVSWKVIIYIVYHITWMNCALLLNVYHLFVAIYILLYIYIYIVACHLEEMKLWWSHFWYLRQVLASHRSKN